MDWVGDLYAYVCISAADPEEVVGYATGIPCLRRIPFPAGVRISNNYNLLNRSTPVFILIISTLIRHKAVFKFDKSDFLQQKCFKKKVGNVVI